MTLDRPLDNLGYKLTIEEVKRWEEEMREDDVEGCEEGADFWGCVLEGICGGSAGGLREGG